ncbi:MAG: MBL fold metallo-hydrolase [Nitrosospira sp.]
MHTPGHTDGHFAFLADDRVFTGDALLIEGCGCTDFQNGDADALFRSGKEKPFSYQTTAWYIRRMTIMTDGSPRLHWGKNVIPRWETTVPSKISGKLWQTSIYPILLLWTMSYRETGCAVFVPMTYRKNSKIIVYRWQAAHKDSVKISMLPASFPSGQ